MSATIAPSPDAAVQLGPAPAVPRESDRSAGEIPGTVSHRPPKVLLVGYNGATNTGAEALLQADIADLRALLGPDALLTVPTLNERNLRRYLTEGPNLRIVPIPPIYVLAFRRLVREHDLVLLVEGSAYMDTWTSALLWAFLWATRCADAAAKPCLAYAVDAGQLKSSLNRRLVRREASKTDLIVARSAAAAQRLRDWGVTAPLEVTADNAFTFRPNQADEGLLRRCWPEASGGVVGFCPVNIHLWPVVIRPWGRKENCYRWPYYFSDSPERREGATALAAGYAALADRLITAHGKSVALLAMEGLDEPFCRQIHEAMTHRERARVFSAHEYNASQLTLLLRSLDLLVTSRYHGSVLSLAAAVPQVAVGHDLRLKTLYAELGLEAGFFLDARAPDLWSELTERVEALLANPEPVRELLRHGHEDHLTAARRNRELLRGFLAEHGWETA
jgi:polysaccharide pyruvyl transferase WcaK-like protein